MGDARRAGVGGERWWELAGELGARIEAIIGAPAGSVNMHENVTTAEAVALSCVTPGGPKRTIVCTAMDFPSAVYLYKAQRPIMGGGGYAKGVARPEGLEPPAYRFEACRSIQLSYGRRVSRFTRAHEELIEPSAECSPRPKARQGRSSD